MITMPLTYSISHGIALAFLSYALIKLASGKASSVNPAIWVVAALSLASFIVLYNIIKCQGYLALAFFKSSI